MSLILIYAFVFAAVLLAVDSLLRYGVSLSRSRREVNDRLARLTEGGGNQSETYRQLLKDRSATTGWGERGIIAWMTRVYRQSGLRLSVQRRMLYAVGFVLAGIVAADFLFPTTLGQVLFGPPIGLALMLLSVIRIRSRRIRKFVEQLPLAIEIIVRSLNAGHPLTTAIALVGREMADPIGSEFGLLSDQLTFGSELDDAMLNMVDRVGAEELSLLAVTVSVQRGTGGNLAEILENLSNMIRDRGTIRGKIKAISAEGRITSVIMAIFPFALYTLISLLVPTYFDPVWESGYGTQIVVALLVIMSIGMFILNRLVRFDF
ncbi:pilus assembly protein TadB [Gemmobacter aquarius]|uniref:Pilus assembly protein TadB n=1 Tax=Paragemmobacter aquarius TaxID=2169400 RepID=A0A2S0UNW3_9RHOB|nr:type II secretion system F family protein [Gemmobacter aquarius]AWB49506.1 pilus assembly protein TadB [Gemmobacter aquarius]